MGGVGCAVGLDGMGVMAAPALRLYLSRYMSEVDKALAERDRYEAALQKIVEHARIMTEDYNEAADGPHEVLAQHARTALEGEGEG